MSDIELMKQDSKRIWFYLRKIDAKGFFFRDVYDFRISLHFTDNHF